MQRHVKGLFWLLAAIGMTCVIHVPSSGMLSCFLRKKEDKQAEEAQVEFNTPSGTASDITAETVPETASGTGIELQPGEVFDLALVVKDQLPDGQEIKSADFDQYLDKKAVDLLARLGVACLERTGDHVRAELNSPASAALLPTLEIRVDSTIEFDVAVNGQQVEVSKVSGVRITVPVVSASLPLKKAIASKDSAGDIQVTTYLLISRFLPYLPYTVTVPVGP